MRTVLLCLLWAAVAVSLSSCADRGTPSRGEAKAVRLALVANGIGDFWIIARAGVEKAEKDFNADCDLRMPTHATATEQKAIVEYMLVKGVSGIAISPMDPANQLELLNTIASRANLICVDSDLPTSRRICYIGTDNVQAGREAGKALLEVLPKGGKVMIFVGNLDATNARERVQGVREAIRGSNVEIIDILTDETDNAKARANAEDTLIRHPDIAGLVGLWSYNGPACADAVKAAGKVGKVKIIAFDQEYATLQAIKNGVISATIAQNPFQVGYESVRVLAALARGEDPGIPESEKIDTGVIVVRKDNVDAYWKTLREQKGEE